MIDSLALWTGYVVVAAILVCIIAYAVSFIVHKLKLIWYVVAYTIKRQGKVDLLCPECRRIYKNPDGVGARQLEKMASAQLRELKAALRTMVNRAWEAHDPDTNSGPDPIHPEQLDALLAGDFSEASDVT